MNERPQPNHNAIKFIAKKLNKLKKSFLSLTVVNGQPGERKKEKLIMNLFFFIALKRHLR